MVVLALFTALALDQFRPLRAHHRFYGLLRAAAHRIRRLFDADVPSQAWLVWVLTVAAPALLSWGVFALLDAWLGGFWAFLWMVLVLYAAIDFRAFGLHFTQVRNAFGTGDVPRAQAALQRWSAEFGDACECRLSASSPVPRSPLQLQACAVRLSVLHMHRCVFGVFTAFLLLAFLGFGPLGAVLFRLSGYVQRWHEDAARQALSQRASPALAAAAQQAWQVVNWLPARVTMLMFAAVGRFDEAVSAWRAVAAQGGDSDALVMATAVAAMGQSPAMPPAMRAATLQGGPHQLLDAQPPFHEEDSEHAAAALHALAGMIWRTLVLWALLWLVIGLIGAVS